MKSQNFQIKVALLGHVSVGKTTLLNALLGDKFSEVSKKRTTAGINHFYISSLLKNNGSSHTSTTTPSSSFLSSSSTGISSADTFNEDDALSAAEIFSKIKIDNTELRKNPKIVETTLHIELAKPLIEMMNTNTNLVITDVPGVNEAGTCDMYLDHVQKIWDTFDCVVIIIDASQGVNTEDQVKLLEFAKLNIDKKKDVPIIILCNKVDDPSDSEMMSLVREVEDKVHEIFKVRNKVTLKPKESKNKLVSPVVLHLSAENAYVYRAAAGLTRANMHLLGKECITKIGQDEVGRFKWKNLPESKQYDVVYEVVSDEAQYKERLASTNFDWFLKVLDEFIGKANQVQLIKKQLDIEVNKLSVSDDYCKTLGSILDKCIFLKMPVDHVSCQFWKLYDENVTTAIESFRSDIKKKDDVHRAMRNLIKYKNDLSKKIFLLEGDEVVLRETKKIFKSARDLVISYIECVISCLSTTVSITNDPNQDPWRYQYNNYNGGYHWYNSKAGSTMPGDGSDHPQSGAYTSHWTWDNRANNWRNRYKAHQVVQGESTKNPALCGHEELSWMMLYPRDQQIILSSILLLKYNKIFCEQFSLQITDLEWYQGKNNDYSCDDHLIKVPSSPISENHFGHLIWLFCNHVHEDEFNFE